MCTIASAILRLVGRNLGRIRWAKHATPREHHRVREGVEVGISTTLQIADKVFPIGVVIAEV